MSIFFPIRLDFDDTSSFHCFLKNCCFKKKKGFAMYVKLFDEPTTDDFFPRPHRKAGADI